jgi:16S rRNA (cytosine1402-N4)-methyltransferase
MTGSEYHRPVMLHQAIEALDIKPGGVYVDVTFGGGGHSREILKHLEEGRLIAFDQDPEAIANAPVDPRFRLVQENFRNIGKALREMGVNKVDGLLADLGVSSHQFDSPERGFSLRFEGRLDMRMDMKAEKSAWHIINEYEHGDLARILRTYGDIENAGTLANTIMKARPIDSVMQLKECTGRYAKRGKEHKFFAQLFQALRIEVNDEMGALRSLLVQIPQLLNANGKLVVISYHSLEDRLVKNYMKTGSLEGELTKDIYGNVLREMEPTLKKAMVPEEEEINENNRARSAKMRVAIKL